MAGPASSGSTACMWREGTRRRNRRYAGMAKLLHLLLHGRKGRYPEVVLDVLAVPSYFCTRCGRRYYA